MHETMTPPFGPLGYITYKRTYARRIREDDINSPTEEFHQSIERVINACKTQLNCGFTATEEQRLQKYLWLLKGSVAGRFWWQLGTKTVDKLGLMSLQNCAFTVVNHWHAFTWAMDALMLGAGVGFNIQKEFVYQLPKANYVKLTRKDTTDADFIIPDCREGWIRLLEELLRSHFETGRSFSYSTILVRKKGELIHGFGGIASGPEDLCFGIEKMNEILNSRAGQLIQPVDCLDILNLIGYIVVSGNVRRSAELAIGDCDDLEFLFSKRWDLGTIPNWRAMSNNSVACDDINSLPQEFWEGYLGNGEPFGLINLKNARRMGRAGDTRYKDPDVLGFNPCAEQPLAPYETCSLAEVFLPNISSIEEMKDLVFLLYRVNKHALALPCHYKKTEEIVHKNMRMGIGVTGYLQASEEQRSWLPEVYESLRNYDKEYSQKKGWPRSIKLTTVKPSGTLSLLPHVTPGVHPAYAQYYLRRIRIAANSPLVRICKEHGYDIEYQRLFDGEVDQNTVVVSFPCRVPEGTILAKNTTALQQLEYVKRLQIDWSDNAVSCTIYYKKEELPEIKKWLKINYNDYIKSVSFLLYSKHGFIQAPYEEISKTEYEAYAKKVKPILTGHIDEMDIVDSMECATGVCPVK